MTDVTLMVMSQKSLIKPNHNAIISLLKLYRKYTVNSRWIHQWINTPKR